MTRTKCTGGFELPESGPCPVCGATEGDLCRRAFKDGDGGLVEFPALTNIPTDTDTGGIMPDWLPIDQAPERGVINVRSVTAYRWLQYSGKSQQFKRGIKGRWQRATEYGWENAALPEGAEFRPNGALS